MTEPVAGPSGTCGKNNPSSSDSSCRNSSVEDISVHVLNYWNIPDKIEFNVKLTCFFCELDCIVIFLFQFDIDLNKPARMSSPVTAEAQDADADVFITALPKVPPVIIQPELELSTGAIYKQKVSEKKTSSSSLSSSTGSSDCR